MERGDMTMLCNIESGNITLLLSKITGAEQTEIEQMLMNGTNPAEVADHYGKYDEFNAFFKSNIISKLNALINNNEISVSEANRFLDQAVNF